MKGRNGGATWANNERGVRGIGRMSGGVCDSGQAIGGAIGGSARARRGEQKVEGMPRSEQECWSEQKWIGARKQSGDLSSGQKLSGKWTGERMYWMDVAGWEEG